MIDENIDPLQWNLDDKAGEPSHREELLKLVRAEMQTVANLTELKLQDSRIGFESSNQYFYTLQDLKEKMINLAYCEEQLGHLGNQSGR